MTSGGLWDCLYPLYQKGIASIRQARCSLWPGGGVLVAFLALCAMVLSISATAATLRIGTISADPAKEMKEFQPLAAYLKSRLGNHGIDSVVVVVAQDVRQMANLLKTGNVDLFFDSPFTVLVARHFADNQILLRRWKRGVADYSGVIFTRYDAGIPDLKRLAGEMVAFEEPYSTASYYLPKSHMTEAGLKMSRKSDVRDKVAKDEVGYVFSGDDRNTMAWVLTGRVKAGAMNNEIFEKLAKGHEINLQILSMTMQVPRHLVSYRKNLDARLLREIRTILEDMEHTTEGLVALKAFNKTMRFDQLTDADRKALDRLQAQLKVGEELSGIEP